MGVLGLQVLMSFLLIITQPAMAQKKYIENLDVNRYMGVWYELARFPHKFERNLVGVTATYSLTGKGDIKVENAGHYLTLGGKIEKAIGKARFAGKKHNGHLKVSFFLWFYSDYYIMELDDSYKWALIGSSSDKYLWILSREPHMDRTTYEMILDKARSLGYDLSNLQEVPQELP